MLGGPSVRFTSAASSPTASNPTYVRTLGTAFYSSKTTTLSVTLTTKHAMTPRDWALVLVAVEGSFESGTLAPASISGPTNPWTVAYGGADGRIGGAQCPSTPFPITSKIRISVSGGGTYWIVGVALEYASTAGVVDLTIPLLTNVTSVKVSTHQANCTVVSALQYGTQTTTPALPPTATLNGTAMTQRAFAKTPEPFGTSIDKWQCVVVHDLLVPTPTATATITFSKSGQPWGAVLI